MAKLELPSPELLRKLLRYEPETGELFWLKRSPEFFKSDKLPLDLLARRWNTKFQGKRAGNLDPSNGYIKIAIFSQRFYAHRIAWAMEYGEWPKGEIDHINHCEADNRITNLRVVSKSQNAKNKKPLRKQRIGIFWEKERSKWRVDIGHERQRYFVGRFECYEDALNARTQKEKEFGFHENHGIDISNRIAVSE